MLLCVLPPPPPPRLALLLKLLVLSVGNEADKRESRDSPTSHETVRRLFQFCFFRRASREAIFYHETMKLRPALQIADKVFTPSLLLSFGIQVETFHAGVSPVCPDLRLVYASKVWLRFRSSTATEHSKLRKCCSAIHC